MTWYMVTIPRQLMRIQNWSLFKMPWCSSTSMCFTFVCLYLPNPHNMTMNLTVPYSSPFQHTRLKPRTHSDPKEVNSRFRATPAWPNWFPHQSRVTFRGVSFQCGQQNPKFNVKTISSDQEDLVHQDVQAQVTWWKSRCNGYSSEKALRKDRQSSGSRYWRIGSSCNGWKGPGRPRPKIAALVLAAQETKLFGEGLPLLYSKTNNTEIDDCCHCALKCFNLTPGERVVYNTQLVV